MDEKALAYFSLVNPLARKIINDQKKLRNALGDEWDRLDWQKQEDILDDFFVDISVREKFADIQRSHEYPVSFPKLKVETGEKIVVDFENDCWTWQDEHSSPFNWRTKSQQDLTLDDLEDEVLSKPVKQKKKESPTNTAEINTAPREFSVNTAGSIWQSPFLQGMKKPDFLNRSRSESPAKSTTTTSRESLARSKTPEEVNYAFTGSMDDLSSSPSVDPDQRSPSVSSTEILHGSPTNEHGVYKPGRRQRSFSKSPIRNVLSSSKDSNPDKGSLVSKRDEDDNAFDNPVLGHEWSNFVNDDEGPESATPSPYKKLLKEPEPFQMDRGDNSSVKLIAGSQHIDMVDNQIGDMTAGSKFDDDQDEILVVEQTTPQPSDLDQHNASSVSKTGFDFLDNW